jgi:DNA-binding transcriptional LysR family regulator
MEQGEALMEIDLRAVRSFVTLATTLSFTKAATLLKVAQPQLSVRIQGLESQLGFRLFERTSRQVRLTKQGERLLPYAERLLHETESLLGEAHDIRFDIKNTLRVGAADYFQPIRSRFLRRYMQGHPTDVVEVEPLRDNSESLAGLLSGRFDIAFILCFDDELLPVEFQRLVLARQPLGLLVPAISPLAKKSSLKPSDLADLSVGLFRREVFPVLHDHVVNVMSPWGARILRLPEPSEAGLLDFVRGTGTPAVCARWWLDEEDQPVGVVHRLIQDVSMHLLCALVRLRSRVSPGCDRLWRMAQRGVANQEAVPN